MPEQFLFRCRACGRVAPETGWRVIPRRPWADALNLRRYPIVECPGCESRDIDMNHGLRVEAEPTMRLHEPEAPHQHEN